MHLSPPPQSPEFLVHIRDALLAQPARQSFLCEWIDRAIATRLDNRLLDGALAQGALFVLLPPLHALIGVGQVYLAAAMTANGALVAHTTQELHLHGPATLRAAQSWGTFRQVLAQASQHPRRLLVVGLKGQDPTIAVGLLIGVLKQLGHQGPGGHRPGVGSQHLHQGAPGALPITAFSLLPDVV
jgi:hypothetical protein